MRFHGHPDRDGSQTPPGIRLPPANEYLHGHAIRFLLATLLCATGSSCDGRGASEVDPTMYSTDLHISIAKHRLTVPLVAAEDYAYQRQTFTLNNGKDRDLRRQRLRTFLQDTSNPRKPLDVDELSVVIRTYGWDDSNAGLRPEAVCPLLGRAWARSACNNPWSAVQQSLPPNRFRLVDLSRLDIDPPDQSVDCVDGKQAAIALPATVSDAAIICEAKVFGGDRGEFHVAAVRIDGDLGAIWTVWSGGQNGETAEAMARREGNAIDSFVRFAVGESEDFITLHDTLCQLRRPASATGPHGADCAPHLQRLPARR